jgi:hypothetical protein
MTLEQLLTAIRTMRLVLTYDRRGQLVIWGPNKDVPLSVTRAVRSYRQRLQEMIDASDIATCASPDLHRSTWRYAGAGAFRCAVCERLLQEVS